MGGDSTERPTLPALQRVMPDLMGPKNILVMNDDAHRRYREKPGDPMKKTFQVKTGTRQKKQGRRGAADKRCYSRFRLSVPLSRLITVTRQLFERGGHMSTKTVPLRRREAGRRKLWQGLILRLDAPFVVLLAQGFARVPVECVKRILPEESLDQPRCVTWLDSPYSIRAM